MRGVQKHSRIELPLSETASIVVANWVASPSCRPHASILGGDGRVIENLPIGGVQKTEGLLESF